MIGFKTEGTKTNGKDFIKEHKLSGWIHAWDPDAQSNYRRLYDVYSTPVVSTGWKEEDPCQKDWGWTALMISLKNGYKKGELFANNQI